MASTYGKTPQFSGLNYGQTASAYEAPKESSTVDYLPDWLDWTLVGLEIAANFIPGVGQAISAGLGAIQASITTAEITQNGQLGKSWWQLGLAWGGTLVGGYGAMKQIAKNTASGLAKLETKALDMSLKAQTDLQIEMIEESIRVSLEKANQASFFSKARVFEKGVKQGVKDTLKATRPTDELIAEFANESGLVLSESMYEGIKLDWQIANRSLGGLSLGTRVADDIGQIIDRSTRKDLVDGLSKTTGKLLDEFLEILQRLSSRAVGLSTSRKLLMIRRFIRSLTIAQQAELRGAMWKILSDSTLTLNKSMRVLTGTPKNFWKMVNSSSFYQHEVQWFQNINASDLGRYIAEKGFQRINKWFDKTKMGKWLIGLSKRVPKLLRVEGKLEKAFVQSGGKIINSRYLLGYKILTTVGTGHLAVHEVMVKFRPHATNKKKPIIIKATTLDLEELSTQGSSYWFRVGAAKGWFSSRGGKGGEGEITHEIGMILSFLPVQALRSFGSIISNIKAFEHTLRKGVGAYPWEVFRNTVNTALNRTGRFGAKKVIGRFARSPLAGRIAQQTITMGLNASGGGFTNKSFGFEWKKPKSMLHLLQVGAKTRTLSELKKRVYKKTGLRPAAQGAKRKLGAVSRVGKGLYSGW